MAYNHTFSYVIDLNERDSFYAHVEDEDGEEITYNGILWIVEDGFMKNYKDVTGLSTYLRQMKVISSFDTIVFQR